jgi:ribosomal protein S18 acetylase RimI-like enzyme
MLTIRDATPEDAHGISATHVLAWQIAYAHVMPADYLAALDVDARAALRREWLEMATGRREPVTLVADRDGEILGHATYGAQRDTGETRDIARAEIYSIYVGPDHWSTGAGRALMDEALARLAAAGARTVMLWVLADNPRARRFYERAGFAADGGEKTEDYSGTSVLEVRYRRELP